MNKKSEEQEPAFKVVDRRRFDEEGHEKECCDHDHHDHAHEAHTSTSGTPIEPKPAAEPSRQDFEMNFSMFIQTLAHQAMMGLGLVPWPDSGLVKKDAVLAKETIDLLHMLKAKTNGNLEKDEQALLEGMLYQLQVAYVEIIK